MNAEALRLAAEAAEAALTAHFVPAWGLTLYLRPLSLRASMRLADAKDMDPAEAVALIVARSACDAQGARIWADADAPKLADMSGDVVSTLAGAVRQLNKLALGSAEAAAEKKGS